MALATSCNDGTVLDSVRLKPRSQGFKKDLFYKSGGFDLSFQKGLEDYDFYLNLLYRQNAVIYRIPEILFFYRIKSTLESRNKKASIECKTELKQFIENKYPELKDYRSFWGWGLYYIKRYFLLLLGKIESYKY